MNAVVIAVAVMLILSLARVHVVLSLLLGALAGGLTSGLGLAKTMEVFQTGLANGAQIALSYAMLGAFAVAIAHSGLPQTLANAVIRRLDNSHVRDNVPGSVNVVKWGLLLALLAMSVMSQNLIPIHIAFIPLIIPPLLLVFNRIQLDRRLLACVMTFGLVTTYMWLPVGFGEIFLKQILVGNITKSGLNVDNINVVQAMTIPALGMIAGLLVAVFISYRRPRIYQNTPADVEANHHAAAQPKISTYRSIVAVLAIVISFAVQLWAGSLLLGAMVGFAVFMAAGVVRWGEADTVFNNGVKMMAMIGFIMIAAQGFAEVMKATGQIEPLVKASAEMFAGNKGMAALIMLLVGLLVTMGIGSSFSTLPIIATIYVPLCISMGFSPMATLALIGTAGALGDAGSPASDSTLGPTAGLNVDGQHDHVRDTVIPTFLHYNLPLMVSGWIASMVL
ncbi:MULTISPECIES: Na+/H+ antiporter family protein [unclassified Neisseria]|uniref:Na+/H+ antiporter family protein n=1 Tax=unclassified Neisseria TaxID=2623750 RepID=UPI0026667A02|nr:MULTISPECIES: Na+/H+ antiporter NhaC family protein [unclassified Neisseria]MDO1510854.1 Na+/H+ antiporter NhaC family protein [Neisseria sp. MVDL19-042950]MDO1517144.1 Na+/H+ antiporter NhaC family protein [Neisseria sp. MVDL18-041461]MDO1564507.1 Na+/H+ antiporter NhaC family protein [Neisseria sp. MVDL20-010259]